jgi:hypothetical protein
VYFIAGLGTPVGGIGLEALARWSLVELAAGLGVGLGVGAAAHGVTLAEKLQWALMPRLRLWGPWPALTLGVGVSWGRYAEVGVDSEQDCPQCIADVVWLNAEVGGELWTTSGFALRCFLGFARSVRATPTTSGSYIGNHYTIPYTGAGVGYAF